MGYTTLDALPFVFVLCGMLLFLVFVFVDRVGLKKQKITVNILRVHRYPETYMIIDLENNPVYVNISSLYADYLVTEHNAQEPINITVTRGRISGYLYNTEAI